MNTFTIYRLVIELHVFLDTAQQLQCMPCSSAPKEDPTTMAHYQFVKH